MPDSVSCYQFGPSQPESVKPEPYARVRATFPDGSREVGFWSGRYWWFTGREIAPITWEAVIDGRMTV